MLLKQSFIFVRSLNYIRLPIGQTKIRFMQMVKSIHMTKIRSAFGLRRIVPFYLIEMNHYSISFETSNVLPIYTKLLVRWENIWSDTFDPHLCENFFNKISIFLGGKSLSHFGTIPFGTDSHPQRPLPGQTGRSGSRSQIWNR